MEGMGLKFNPFPANDSATFLTPSKHVWAYVDKIMAGV